MIRWILAAALAAATLSGYLPSAHAADGDYAQHSAKWAAFIANCTDAGMSQKGRDAAAKKLEAMSQAQFDLQIRFCSKREAAAHPPQRDVIKVGYSHREAPLYQGDRDLLILKSLGPNGRVIKDEAAPDDAVPCVVKGVRGMCHKQ